MESLVNYSLYNNIYKNKKILITGHTGFKGSWLSVLLKQLGAEVYGYALKPPTTPSMYIEAGVEKMVTSYIGDIRDFEFLLHVVKIVKPELIIHMAAQPLVLESYKNPIETYSVNVMGTVNLLEAIRLTPGIKAIVNVTTDKCYENQEWYWGYRENDPIGGYDPYSNSKGCSELITASFRNSFFNQNEYTKHGLAIATARAGNVIGGGDWAEDRLIPDFIRSITKNEMLTIRNPLAIRPWQHVLEPLSGYLNLASHLLQYGIKYNGAWNFGPDNKDVKTVEWITNKICTTWGNGASYKLDLSQQPHEANYLKLDCSKSKIELNWYPKWDIEKSIDNVISWNKAFLNGKDILEFTISQIEDYFTNIH